MLRLIIALTKPMRKTLLLASVMTSLAIPAIAQEPTAKRNPGLQHKNGLQVVEPDAADRELRMTPVVRAVQKAADSVVSIFVNHDQTSRIGNRMVTEGQGSGVILDETGFVITNWHVIASTLDRTDYQVQIKLKDGRTRMARVVSSSALQDLALLKMQLEKNDIVKPVEIGRSADLMIGETLLAIGNPQGHANTVTQGVLSATGRTIHAVGPDRVPRDYSGLLQTDAAINPGNSGGALLDITGKLVGINNAMAMGAENIGFAIPVDTVREVFEKDLLASDSFASVWLGMELSETNGSLIVRQISAGGPAAQAGMRKGDAVLAAGEQQLHTMLDWTRTVLAAPLGKAFPLRINRGGVEVRLAPKPMARAVGDILSMSGVEIDEVDDSEDPATIQRATRVFYGNNRRGALLTTVLRIKSVQPDSPAALLELQPGDLLLATTLSDGFRTRDYRLDSLTAFADLLRQAESRGQGLRLVVLRGTEDLVGTLDVSRRKH